MFYCKKCKKFHDAPGEYDGFNILPSCPECGEKMNPTPAIGYGTKINGFIVQHELGRGAVGAVYLAKQCNAEVFVAVKVLLPSSMKDAKFAENFFREARAAAALNHPNIVHAQDAGITDNGICYFIMELIEGENLEEKVERSGALPMLEALDAACCISDALAYAWRSQKLCHGDIKPENVIVRPDGVVKLADLGLAKDYKNGISSDSEIMATPAYAPPEVIRGEVNRISFKSDMYSFGETLYHILTGTPPFPGDDAAAVCNMQLNNQPPPVIAVNEDVPEKLSMLVDDLMEKSPDKRPSSWDEVNERLEEIRSEWIGSHVKKAKPVDVGVRLLPEDDDEIGVPATGEERPDEPPSDASVVQETGNGKKKIILIKHGSSTFNVIATIVIIHLLVIAIFYALFCELSEPGYLKKTYEDTKSMVRNFLNEQGFEMDPSDEEGSDEVKEEEEKRIETTVKPSAVTEEKTTVKIFEDEFSGETPAAGKVAAQPKTVRKNKTPAAVKPVVREEEKKNGAEEEKIRKLGVARDKLFREIEENYPIRYRSDVIERQERAKALLAAVDKSGVADQVLSKQERTSIENYVASLGKLLVSHPAPKDAERELAYVRDGAYEKEKSVSVLEMHKNSIERVISKNNEITTGGFLSPEDASMLENAVRKIETKKEELHSAAVAVRTKKNAYPKRTEEEAHRAVEYAILSCSAVNETGTRKLLKELDKCEEKYGNVISKNDVKVIADVRMLCGDAWTKSISSIVKEEGNNLKGIEILPRELPGYRVESVDAMRIKVMLNSGGAKVFSYVSYPELDGKNQYAIVSKLVYSNNLKNFSEENQRILLKRMLLSGRSTDNAAAKFRRASNVPKEEIDSLVATAKLLNGK